MNTKNETKKIVLISSITSDIGTVLAEKFYSRGWEVIGTYRSDQSLKKMHFTKKLYYCNFDDKISVSKFIQDFGADNYKWDLFISCAGTQKPIGNFFNCDFEEWSRSIHINAIEQLRILHGVYPFRNSLTIPTAIFFAGGGTNNAVQNYSAYTASKIMLMKMTELIDFENKDIKVAIIGPGWTKTKIHQETINEKRGVVGNNYNKTLKFMENDAGTDITDIFDCINFIYNENKNIIGGRNFSVVYDLWKSGLNNALKKELALDPDMYKLRRYKNTF